MTYLAASQELPEQQGTKQASGNSPCEIKTFEITISFQIHVLQYQWESIKNHESFLWLQRSITAMLALMLSHLILKLAFMDRPPLRAPSTPGPSGRIFGKESTDRGRMLSDNCDSHQATAWGSEYLRRLGNHVELTTAFLDEG